MPLICSFLKIIVLSLEHVSQHTQSHLFSALLQAHSKEKKYKEPQLQFYY